jgi:hypothetical protein
VHHRVADAPAPQPAKVAAPASSAPAPRPAAAAAQASAPAASSNKPRAATISAPSKNKRATAGPNEAISPHVGGDELAGVTAPGAVAPLLAGQSDAGGGVAAPEEPAVVAAPEATTDPAAGTTVTDPAAAQPAPAAEVPADAATLPPDDDAAATATADGSGGLSAPSAP